MQAKLSLSETERALAHRFVRQSKAKARTLTRAWTLLKLADGSWSNMAEIGILERNALSRRLQDEAALRLQVVAVETERNAHKHGIAWQFSSHDARVELERLYPVKDPSPMEGERGTPSLGFAARHQALTSKQRNPVLNIPGDAVGHHRNCGS